MTEFSDLDVGECVGAKGSRGEVVTTYPDRPAGMRLEDSELIFH